ncbi:TPA: hypothetical protein KNT04_002618 [Clostridioides difficile]|nr:hypothetical protein [Clostridioides difficile]
MFSMPEMTNRFFTLRSWINSLNKEEKLLPPKHGDTNDEFPPLRNGNTNLNSELLLLRTMNQKLEKEILFLEAENNRLREKDLSLKEQGATEKYI